MCTERLTTRYISTNALCLKLHENKQVIAETRGFHFFPRFSIRLFCCLCKAHLPAAVCIQSVLQPSPKLGPTILRNAVHSGRRRMTPTVSWSTLWAASAIWPLHNTTYLPSCPLAQITPPRPRKHLHKVQSANTLAHSARLHVAYTSEDIIVWRPGASWPAAKPASLGYDRSQGDCTKESKAKKAE